MFRSRFYNTALSAIIVFTIIGASQAWSQTPTTRRYQRPPAPASTPAPLPPASDSAMRPPSPMPTYTDSEKKMALSAALGFFGPGSNVLYGKIGNNDGSTSFSLSGLVGLGADFDYMMKRDLSVGGLLRYYTTSDTFGNTTYTNNALIIGGMAKGYFVTSGWVMPFGAGLALISAGGKQAVGGNSSDYSFDTAFGPMITWGFLYKLNSDWSAGIENLHVMGLGDKINGWLINDFMLKARMML